MGNLRVLHIDGASGQAGQLSLAERALGLKSDLVVFETKAFGYKFDINLNYKPTLFGKLIFNLNYPKWLAKQIFQYDTFHYYSFYKGFLSSKLAFGNFDIKVLKKFKKKFVIHFLGSDVRQLDVFKKYKFNYSDELGFDVKSEEKKRERIAWYRSFADLLIVSDYELEEYVPGSVVLPLTYDEAAVKKIKPSVSTGNRIKIVHSPSRRIIKGTDFVISAVERLRRDFRDKYEIEFRLVEGVDHLEALEIYAQADICVDQVRLGSYGTFSVESMALGKPVLCYIRPDLIKNYPGLPIVNASPDTLYKKLKELIVNRNLRSKMGVKGKEYVKFRHDPEVVAKQMVRLYEGLYK